VVRVCRTADGNDPVAVILSGKKMAMVDFRRAMLSLYDSRMLATEKPVRPHFTLQILHEISARYYLLLLIVLLALWSSKMWYHTLGTVLLLIFEPARVYAGFRGNLGVSLQWSLAAIALGIFPVVPLDIALMAGDKTGSEGERAGRGVILGLHVVIVIISVFGGFFGIAEIVADYRARHLVN
jgi:uncharacterized membrane protein (DUF2068 family)